MFLYISAILWQFIIGSHMHACELCFYVLNIGTCSLIYVSTYRTCTYVTVHSEYNYLVSIKSRAIQCILLHTLLIHCVHIHAIMYVQLYAYYTIYVGWFHIGGISTYFPSCYIFWPILPMACSRHV